MSTKDKYTSEAKGFYFIGSFFNNNISSQFTKRLATQHMITFPSIQHSQYKSFGMASHKTKFLSTIWAKQWEVLSVYLLRTKVASERNFSVFVDDLFVAVQLGQQVATVVAFVTLHRLRFQVAWKTKTKYTNLNCLFNRYLV